MRFFAVKNTALGAQFGPESPSILIQISELRWSDPESLPREYVVALQLERTGFALDQSFQAEFLLRNDDPQSSHRGPAVPARSDDQESVGRDLDSFGDTHAVDGTTVGTEKQPN